MHNLFLESEKEYMGKENTAWRHTIVFFFYNRYLVRTVVHSHHKKDQITQALKLYQGRKVVKKSSASAFNPGSVCICRGPFLHK